MVSVMTETNSVLPVVSDAALPDDISSCSQSEESEAVDGVQTSDSDLNLGKDSGIDCGPDIRLIPDEETAKAIQEIVEFYFSDANLLKDPFLLKHVRRNKEGYVSVKLISSFRKVRSLCRNWKAVAESIGKSDLLALNSEGTKVRRVTPLRPTYDDSPSRTLLVHGLPADKLTVEGISELFSKCGDIALVRVLRRGSSVNTEVKKYLSKHPEIQANGCGLVEYEESAAAQKALTKDENGLRVVSMLQMMNGDPNSGVGDKTATEVSKPRSPKKKKTKRSKHGSTADLRDSSDVSQNGPKPRRSSSGSVGQGSSGSLSTSPSDNSWLRRHSYHPGGGKDSTSSFASLNSRNHRGSRDRLNKTKSEQGDANDSPAPSSPWRRRRELFKNELTSTLALMVPVLRSPRGPDGSRGFFPRQSLPTTAE